MGQQRYWRRHGFTLVEVLMATSLAAMLLAGTTASMVTMIDGVRVNDSTMRARQAGTRTLDFILGHIRRAKELNLLPTDAPSGEYSLLGTMDDAAWVVTTNETTHEVESGWSLTGQKHSFFMVSEGTLYVGPDEHVENAQPLLSNVSSILFRSVTSGPDSKHRDVTVEITLEVPAAMGGTKSQLTFLHCRYRYGALRRVAPASAGYC